jgi:hypothetical protein
MIIETEGTAGHACIHTPLINLKYHIIISCIIYISYPYHVSYLILSYHVSYLILSCIISSCIISYHVSYLILSCLISSCLSYHFMSYQHLYISWGPIKCASLDSCS